MYNQQGLPLQRFLYAATNSRNPASNQTASNTAARMRSHSSYQQATAQGAAATALLQQAVFDGSHINVYHDAP
jgi:hypothetical protein